MFGSIGGFTKHVWRAHVYYDADFGRTHTGCPKSFSNSAVGRVFDGFFDIVWPCHQTRRKFGHQTFLIVFGHQNILGLTGALGRLQTRCLTNQLIKKSLMNSVAATKSFVCQASHTKMCPVNLFQMTKNVIIAVIFFKGIQSE